ncbi:potassium-transporting ATPase subunit F [Calothrix sp. UHCC 0171]|uniref:potassium-transporting ATPase subunit F n=1 Tax=Calothrix sp. UHCC 0171 TaxID=3110245 RepID=UPI002B1F2C44|nr:potassium-transporting ATPase subunit F [Calothrix sp. UHCC 0171]MEA5571708.1 potassium-transporting ATPase subunit F [Calothrix sp. UHCC 0171]
MLNKLKNYQSREFIFNIWRSFRRTKLPLIIFLGVSLNIIFLPIVYAATDKIEPRHTYAIAGLSIIAFGIIIYLFDVIFRPERY